MKVWHFDDKAELTSYIHKLHTLRAEQNAPACICRPTCAPPWPTRSRHSDQMAAVTCDQPIDWRLYTHVYTFSNIICVWRSASAHL